MLVVMRNVNSIILNGTPSSRNEAALRKILQYLQDEHMLQLKILIILHFLEDHIGGK